MADEWDPAAARPKLRARPDACYDGSACGMAAGWAQAAAGR